jgi:hypothetical protein
MNLSAAITTAAVLAAPLACVCAEPARAAPLETAQQGAFYCDLAALDPEGRKRHFDVLGPALVGRRIAVRELPDGYEIQFPSDAQTYKELVEYLDGERACCPFFDLSLHITPDRGPLSLRVTGKAGTKQFIEAEAAGWIKPIAVRK